MRPPVSKRRDRLPGRAPHTKFKELRHDKALCHRERGPIGACQGPLIPLGSARTFYYGAELLGTIYIAIHTKHQEHCRFRASHCLAAFDIHPRALQRRLDNLCIKRFRGALQYINRYCGQDSFETDCQTL